MKEKKIQEIEKIIQSINKQNELEEQIKSELNNPSCFIMRKTEASVVFGDLHHHELYEMLYVISGKLSYSIEGEHYELNEGDLILVSPLMLHKLDKILSKESKRFVLNFSETYAKKLSTNHCNLLKAFEIAAQRKNCKISLDSSSRKTLEKYLNLMVDLQFSSEFGDDLAFNLRFCLALLLVNKFILNSREEKELVSTNNKLVLEAVDYINKNFDQKILISDISNKLSISKSRLSHIFKEETGLSVHQFLLKKRLVFAKDFIKKGEQIKTIYSLCGFNDNTSFYRAFKKEFLITPKKYLSTCKMNLE